ncbi:MAG: ABC transporter ATP-binding protein, partial [Firmicutes bacterium]|nr:ABC transporter ATP-binding protein [Bacillota bacterium]
MSLTVEGLSFRYGVEPILADVDLVLQPGQVLCLLGANGCGKTTLLKVLGGLRRPTRGQVLLGGVPLEAVAPADLAKK